MPKRPFDLPEPEILTEGVQPEAAIAFWAWKDAMPYDAVKQLADGARDRAFYVTALAEHDAAQAVKDALGKALEEGETLTQFQEDLAGIIESQGWKGHRIETIFRNNLQTAYSAGRYAKMQEVKKSRPYWQYITVGDEKVRPSHAILSGMVFHADDEFWAENYPPNGHRCRCGVITLSARQLEREGLEVQEGAPGDSMYTDPKTGMESHVARPGADEGWRNNPGKTWIEGGAATGLDLKKYPDVTPESYAEQRLRPAPVKDFAELADGIKDKCGKYCVNSQGAVSVIKGYPPGLPDSFMATDSNGKIWINNRAFSLSRGFNAASDLQKAWNKLAEGKPLLWLEEYAVESLWHELTHNRQTVLYMGQGDTIKRRVFEIVTQWTARRTYPELLQALGATPSHLESIKKSGLGYSGWISLFDRLASVLKIDETALLQEMRRIIDVVPSDAYRGELAAWLAKQSGHSKGAISNALGEIDYTTGAQDFEQILEEAGLLEDPKPKKKKGKAT
jgi:SPP1 gp7 family putative phage head morphogenesis protein